MCRCPQHAPAARADTSAPATTSGALARPRRETTPGTVVQRCADGASCGCRACLEHDLAAIGVEEKRRPDEEPGSEVRAATDDHKSLPPALKAGLEHLSGLDLSRVRVHRGSPEPARLGALAFAEGTDIHLARGQERHLPHEGWHVVQQLEGRVQPTGHIGERPVSDDPRLEREADAEGRRAATFQTRLAGAGDSEEEELFAAALRRPVVQRAATFKAGTVTATNNLAAHFIAGERNVGFTPPTLNGTRVQSEAAAQRAIKAPTLTKRTLADGTAEALVATAPTNEGSFTEQLPSNGPWSTRATRAAVSAILTEVGLKTPAACTRAGDTTWTVRGRPNDKDFAANVRTHENLHVADHEAGFKAVLVPWDKKVEAAKAAGTVFKGANEAAAETALFKAMGGTPKEVAGKQATDWIARNHATHAGKRTLASGGVATPSNATANATCTTSSMDVT